MMNSSREYGKPGFSLCPPDKYLIAGDKLQGKSPFSLFALDRGRKALYNKLYLLSIKPVAGERKYGKRKGTRRKGRGYSEHKCRLYTYGERRV
jgi:hypothetical protein